MSFDNIASALVGIISIIGIVIMAIFAICKDAQKEEGV